MTAARIITALLALMLHRSAQLQAPRGCVEQSGSRPEDGAQALSISHSMMKQAAASQCASSQASRSFWRWVYYQCPSLCNMILNGVLRSVKTLSERRATIPDRGREFSIRETPLMGRRKSKHTAARSPGAESSWHFLTGDEKSSKTLPTSGFPLRVRRDSNQYATGARSCC